MGLVLCHQAFLSLLQQRDDFVNFLIKGFPAAVWILALVPEKVQTLHVNVVEWHPAFFRIFCVFIPTIGFIHFSQKIFQVPGADLVFRFRICHVIFQIRGYIVHFLLGGLRISQNAHPVLIAEPEGVVGIFGQFFGGFLPVRLNIFAHGFLYQLCQLLLVYFRFRSGLRIGLRFRGWIWSGTRLRVRFRGGFRFRIRFRDWFRVFGDQMLLIRGDRRRSAKFGLITVVVVPAVSVMVGCRVIITPVAPFVLDTCVPVAKLTHISPFQYIRQPSTEYPDLCTPSIQPLPGWCRISILRLLGIIIAITVIAIAWQRHIGIAVAVIVARKRHIGIVIVIVTRKRDVGIVVVIIAIVRKRDVGIVVVIIAITRKRDVGIVVVIIAIARKRDVGIVIADIAIVRKRDVGIVVAVIVIVARKRDIGIVIAVITIARKRHIGTVITVIAIIRKRDIGITIVVIAGKRIIRNASIIPRTAAVRNGRVGSAGIRSGAVIGSIPGCGICR